MKDVFRIDTWQPPSVVKTGQNLIVRFATGRMFCHIRMIALPMSYVYGRRFVGEITPTVAQLRNELYNESYQEINWNAQRNNCAKVAKPSRFS